MFTKMWMTAGIVGSGDMMTQMFIEKKAFKVPAAPAESRNVIYVLTASMQGGAERHPRL